jgi:ubiquitin-protein ligase
MQIFHETVFFISSLRQKVMRTLVKRLQKELLFANSNPDESIKLFSSENNLTSWKALIKGIETNNRNSEIQNRKTC